MRRLRTTERRLLVGAVTVAIAGLTAAVIVLATRSTAISAQVQPGHTRRLKAPAVPRYLYVSDAHAGSLVATGKKAGEYDLTLTGVHPTATYFRDRPGNEVGAMSLSRLLAGLLDKPGEIKPNAVVNALVPERGNHQYTMGVKLLAAHYTPKTQRLVYRVSALRQGPSTRREHGRTDVVLPRSFGHTSVFIDDGGNTCGGQIENLTSVPLPQQSWPNNVGKWSSDDWENYPANSITAASLEVQEMTTSNQDDSSFLQYQSNGGASRGCHNWVNLTYPGGTIQVSLTDPYSGSNTANCDVNETDSDYQFKCGYRTYNSTVGGDNMVVDFVICSANPDYQAWWYTSGITYKTVDGCTATDGDADASGPMVWFTP